MADDALTFQERSNKPQIGTIYSNPDPAETATNFMTHKAELTFEIEETVILKQGGYLITEYCPRCQEVIDMVSPDVLSLIIGVSEREIFRLVEAGEIHFFEGARVVICPSCYRHLLANRPQLGPELEFSGSNICENDDQPRLSEEAEDF